MVVLELLAAFALVVGGAIGFTNAVEWLGKRLDLGAGAVGALLAAVGTALPESIIPVVALLGGGSAEDVQIAIGAIIGAPFLLGTIAMLVVTVSAIVLRGRREHGSEVHAKPDTTRRDLRFFLALFPVGIALGVIDSTAGVQVAAAAALVAAYGIYAWRTVEHGGEGQSEDDLGPLYFDPSKSDPPTTLQIGLQFAVSLLAIVGGAELFVSAIESISSSLGIEPLILALVLAPLATELPEKLNSVIWIREGKDVLAVSNISGAMAFQATVPVALGLVATTWELNRYAVAAAVVGLLGAAIALWALPRRRAGLVPSVAWAALFAGFVTYAVIW
jgi:cation:H+ antiporter